MRSWARTFRMHAGVFLCSATRSRTSQEGSPASFFRAEGDAFGCSATADRTVLEGSFARRLRSASDMSGHSETRWARQISFLSLIRLSSTESGSRFRCSRTRRTSMLLSAESRIRVVSGVRGCRAMALRMADCWLWARTFRK